MYVGLINYGFVTLRRNYSHLILEHSPCIMSEFILILLYLFIILSEPIDNSTFIISNIVFFKCIISCLRHVVGKHWHAHPPLYESKFHRDGKRGDRNAKNQILIDNDQWQYWSAMWCIIWILQNIIFFVTRSNNKRGNNNTKFRSKNTPNRFQCRTNSSKGVSTCPLICLLIFLMDSTNALKTGVSCTILFLWFLLGPYTSD